MDLAADVHVARPRVEEVRLAERNGQIQRVEPQAGIAGRGEREDFEGVLVVVRGQARERGLGELEGMFLAREGERDSAVDLIELVRVHANPPDERRRVDRDAGADLREVHVRVQREPFAGKRDVRGRLLEPAVADRDGSVDARGEEAGPRLAVPHAVAACTGEVQPELLDIHQPELHLGQVDVQLVERELPVGVDRERDPRVGRGVAAEVEERRELDVGGDLRRGLPDRTRHEAQLQLAGHRQHAEVVWA